VCIIWTIKVFDITDAPCNYEDHYLDIEMHKYVILFYNSTKINPFNRSFICVNSLKVRYT